MDERLKQLVDDGIIDLSHVSQLVEMAKRRDILNQHPFGVWQGSTGEYWYTYLPDAKRKRRQIKRKTRDAIDDAIIEYWKEREENPTFDQMFTEWNDRRYSLCQISESSYIRYRQIYKRHFGKFGKKKVKITRPLEIVEFLENEIFEKKLSAKSYGGLRDVTRGILKYAKRKEVVKYSISGLFEMLDVSETYFNRIHKSDQELVFSEAETKKLMGFLTEEQDLKNSGLLLLFVSGMRVGEMSTLKHDDINPFECTVSVSRTETRMLREGKVTVGVGDRPKTDAGNREVVIPTQYRWLLTKLWKASENREWVFINRAGTRCTGNQFRKRLKQVCLKLNLKPRSPHKIRATYDSILLDAKLDRRLITDQMGHADINVSERVYHRNRRDIEQKREILSGIEEFAFRQSSFGTG